MRPKQLYSTEITARPSTRAVATQLSTGPRRRRHTAWLHVELYAANELSLASFNLKHAGLDHWIEYHTRRFEHGKAPLPTNVAVLRCRRLSMVAMH